VELLITPLKVALNPEVLRSSLPAVMYAMKRAILPASAPKMKKVSTLTVGVADFVDPSGIWPVIATRQPRIQTL